MTHRWNTTRTLLALAGTTVAIIGVAFSSIVFGGVVSVAATDPHSRPVQWVLEQTMESSIEAHAADVEVPAGIDLGDPALAERAFGHYSVACTPCHGAPGVDPAPWLVLQPPALPLVETAAAWSDAELYWIVKHGIKMTGMPALGPTHEDHDLWAIAAFVRQLPTMTAERYQGMAARQGAAMGHAAHAATPVQSVEAPSEAAVPATPEIAAPPVEATPIAPPTAHRRPASTRRRPSAPAITPEPEPVATPSPSAPKADDAHHDHAMHHGHH